MPEPAAKQGSWVTFPFTLATFTGLILAFGGFLSNLIVYLIQEFNVKSIDAAQISNVVNGCTSLFPVVGAIIADSFLGCFFVIVISSCVSLLGMVLLTLTALLHSLRPEPCENGSSLCQAPSKFQYAVLYAAIALAAIGFGGTRFTLATMGANQFEKPEDRGIFFNWYFFVFYTSSVIASTAIVYIQDNVGWPLGFGISCLANLVGLAIFLAGNRLYRHDMAQGSPFTGLARVVVATLRKRKVLLTSRPEDYLHDQDGAANDVVTSTKKSFRFLNRAALKTEGDLNSDGSIARPWRLCTVQQVEDLKTVIRIFPLWSSSIFLGTPIAIQASLTILQALTMDRHLGPHFQIPAGSILVIVLVTSSIFLPIIDRLLFPLWHKLRNQPPRTLQRIGVGHVFTVLGMVISALVESKRLKIAHKGQVPMSALWLFTQLAVVGIGEAFHLPGQVSLYYQEFPASLKSTSTAMISLIIGIAFYLSTALIDLVRKTTSWLPDNINEGRLDNVYWTLVVAGVLNFGYYLACAKFYRYQNNVHKAVPASA
ncbi:hypothetical protein Tsubulata_036422 [Turnera subulata]|uniref:Protein NRT1/ PTR FAMILY 2.7-like n=1 Tax=Turnera subulata TaxID=218843 RepID=A0A9Q0FIE0_9ROSI|nr:hypothetical protein Tsubulata_036422 [Turnera subulata]